MSSAFQQMVSVCEQRSAEVTKHKDDMRESLVERHLHQFVMKAGGTTRKFKSPGRAQAPDRIVIWPANVARIHFVECKAPGKKPRPGQEREHARLRELGCTVLVLDTIEKVDEYIRVNK